MNFVIIFFCIALLIVMITWAKINAFLAFIIVSITAGLLLGIPFGNIVNSVQKGIGDMLGSLVIIIVLGAMLGKLVADSGAAQRIATTMMNVFGVKYIQWALLVTGIIVGIPLFYGVGFVLIIPLIFSIVYEYKLPAVATGLPMIAALSVTFGFLPPHPAPVALAGQFHANLGLVLIYGLIIAIPAIIIAGPLFAKTLKNIPASPLETFLGKTHDEKRLPGTVSSFICALLPVILLMGSTIWLHFVSSKTVFGQILTFLAEPAIVMLISLAVAAYVLGTRQGDSIKKVMNVFSDAVKDIAMILLIIGSSGALKQVITDSGVSNQIASQLNHMHAQPLLVGWIIAAIIRICVGSATVAGLTTAGLLAPMALQAGVNPNLMVLSIGAGSLACSHVNDSGFWMFKEYFNISIKDTFRSWTMMESIISVVGLAGVLILHIFIK